MLKMKVYNQQGKEIGEEKLNPEVFGVEMKSELVHQAVVAQMANARVPIAHTKTRGEVRGGGRKPWRQKGTGRARAGSIRSPIWRGGGVVFGPRKERVFIQKINKKAKRKALLMCLSDKVTSGWMIVLDRLELEKGKTKEFMTILGKLEKLIKSQKSKVKSKVKNNELKVKSDTASVISGSLDSDQSDEGFHKKNLQTSKISILVALASKDDKVVRAARNIPGVATIRVDSLNVVDLLKYKYLLVTKEGIRKIEEIYKLNKATK